MHASRAVTWNTAISLWLGGVLAACGGAAEPPLRDATAPQGGTISYRVTLPADADRDVRVEACAEGFRAARWEPLGSVRADMARDLHARGACIDYVTNPGDVAGRFAAIATPDAFVGGDASILLRPTGAPAGARVAIRFDAPEGVHVSTPWPREGDAFVPDASFLAREAHVAYGAAVRTSRFEVAGARVERAVLPGTLAVSDAELDAWLRGAIEAVASLAGRFPRDRLQLVVVPVAYGDGPVEFGLVRRGGGASVLLLVNEEADLDALRRDWVAVHELAHLVFPLVDRRDAWLSEGTSTYYQEVLRARAGLIAPRDAWRRLVAGFERGRSGAGDLPIGEESERMMANATFHRVYWSGAAFVMLADLALRARGSSFDALVAAHAPVLTRSNATFTAHDLLARLDAGLDAPFLCDRAAALEASPGVPEVTPALESLGIRVDAAGEVTFEEDADARARRAAIMGGD